MRSIASSRERCATVIDSALKMMNAPTKIATIPKASTNPWRKLTNDFSPSSVKRSCLAAVSTLYWGSDLASVARSCAGATPGFAATSTESTRPALPNSLWAVGRSRIAIVAPPIDFTPPKRTMPVMRIFCPPAAVARPMV